MIFHSHINKTIVTRKVVPLASFWKWGFLELGSHWPIYQGAFDVVHLSLSWPWQPSFDSPVFGNVFPPKLFSFFSWIISVDFTLYLFLMKDEGDVLAQLIKFNIWRLNDVTLRHVTINLSGQFNWVIWIPGSLPVFHPSPQTSSPKTP